MDNRKKIFEDYFNSVYSCSNVLTFQEYENSCNVFHSDFGNFMPSDKNVPILDIGCGTGHFLYYLKKMGYTNHFGIDLSLINVEFCKNNITPNVELADAFEFLTNKINVYGVISANDVLEHIPKEKVIPFLKLIYQTLMTGGILFLRLPNMSNPFALDSRYRDFTHECGFTEKSIYQVLYVAGFRDIHICPSQIRRKSVKSYLSWMLVSLVHAVFKKLFWHQGFTAPEILSSRLVVIAKKGKSCESTFKQ